MVRVWHGVAEAWVRISDPACGFQFFCIAPLRACEDFDVYFKIRSPAKLVGKEWELGVIFLLACTGTASTLRGVAISKKKKMKSLQDAVLLN